MNIYDIKKYELEITSLCNLECPLCHRTKNIDVIEIASLTLEDIKRIFSNEKQIKGNSFLLCGAIGEPVANKECYEIVEYLTSNGGFCELNTNASLQTSSWWYKLGKLSAETNLVSVWFCVDGHKNTNEIYRINSNFNLIEKNIQSYVDGGKGKANATWMYNIFDHNEEELDVARSHAKSLGIKFSVRKGVGNSLGFISTKKIKNKETKEITYTNKEIKSTGNLAHSKIELIKNIRKLIDGTN